MVDAVREFVCNKKTLGPECEAAVKSGASESPVVERAAKGYSSKEGGGRGTVRPTSASMGALRAPLHRMGPTHGARRTAWALYGAPPLCGPYNAPFPSHDEPYGPTAPLRFVDLTMILSPHTMSPTGPLALHPNRRTANVTATMGPPLR